GDGCQAPQAPDHAACRQQAEEDPDRDGGDQEPESRPQLRLQVCEGEAGRLEWDLYVYVAQRWLLDLKAALTPLPLAGRRALYEVLVLGSGNVEWSPEDGLRGPDHLSVAELAKAGQRSLIPTCGQPLRSVGTRLVPLWIR